MKVGATSPKRRSAYQQDCLKRPWATAASNLFVCSLALIIRCYSLFIGRAGLASFLLLFDTSCWLSSNFGLERLCCRNPNPALPLNETPARADLRAGRTPNATRSPPPHCSPKRTSTALGALCLRGHISAGDRPNSTLCWKIPQGPAGVPEPKFWDSRFATQKKGRELQSRLADPRHFGRGVFGE
jgi:hypothetical protein